MVNLSDWNKNNIIKFSVDHTLIDEELTNFPVMLNISTTAGKADYDCTALFEELITPSNVNNFTKYALLLNFENENIQDKSLYKKTNLTSTGTYTLSTTIYKFGTASYSLLPGYISIPSHEGFIIDTQDFTVHGWFYLAASAGTTSFFSIGSYLYGLILIWYAGTTIRLIINGSSHIDTAYTFPLDVWFHLAVTRYNGYVQLFHNGIKIGSSFLFTASILPTPTSYIGKDFDYANGTFNGYVDEFTFIVGESLWSENFTPPTSAVIPATILNKKIAVVYPSVQEHWVDDVFMSYNHGEKEQLYCEIEYWDQANKSLQIWTKVPRVLSNQPTDILVYFDSTQPDNTQYIGYTTESPAQQVWTNGYVAVYNLVQAPIVGTACILDSTVNSNHGTPNSLSNASLVTGLIGKGIQFDGTASFILAPNSLPLTISGTLTMDAFVKTNSSLTNQGVLHKGAISYYGRYAMYSSNTNNIKFRLNRSTVENSGLLTTPIAVGLNTWYNLSATYTKTQQIIHIDGEIQAMTPFTADVTTDTDGLYIGRSYTYVWGGIIQRVSVANVTRSTAWLKATNHTQRDTLCFVGAATLYKISGRVEAFGNPAVRTLYLYDRDSGELVDKVTSDTSGYYSLYTETSNRHNVICLDDTTGLDLSDKVISKIVPVEIV